MKSVVRTIDRDPKGTIVKLLQENKTMTYTQIKHALGITDAAVSKHVGELLSEKTIQFEKKGREKHYRLNENIPTKLERRIPIFAGFFIRNLFEQLDGDHDEKLIKIYEKLGIKLNALFLYTILKSFERGENWLNGFDSKGMAIVTINYLISTIFEKNNLPQDEIPKVFSKDLLDVYFKEIRETITKKKLDRSLKEMTGLLKKMYPEEVNLLDEIMREFKS